MHCHTAFFLEWRVWNAFFESMKIDGKNDGVDTFFKEKDDGVRRHAAGSVPVPPGQGNSFAISPGQHIVTVSFSLILWFLFICVFRKKEYHCNLIGSSLLTRYFSDQPYISTTFWEFLWGKMKKMKNFGRIEISKNLSWYLSQRIYFGNFTFNRQLFCFFLHSSS